MNGDVDDKEGDAVSTITITITLDVPAGTQVAVQASESDTDKSFERIPAEVLDALDRLVPSRYRQHAKEYIDRCVRELECSVQLPVGARQFEYLNIFPPQRCRRTRVAGLTYSSTRTALYTGAIDLAGYSAAEQTMNSGVYAYPKLAHLDSALAVKEALALTKIAIARVER